MKAEFIKTYHNPSSLYFNSQKKWLWLRIHKTAGTSMFDALRNYCYCMAKNKPETENWINDLTDEEINEYFIWTFVRNPYDRFHSISAMFGYNPNDFAADFHRMRTESIVRRHSHPSKYIYAL